MPLCRFKVLVMNIITKYSLKCSIIHFKTETSIDLSLWTDAFNWAKSNTKIESIKSDGKTKILGYNKEPLKEFLAQHFATTRTVLPCNKEDWMNGQCTCKSFLKNLFVSILWD